MAEFPPLPPGVLLFPEGLPGFENLTRFVLLQEEDLLPIVFLRSLAEPNICLPVTPVRCIRPEYDLRLEDDDRRVLDLADQAVPESDLMCLVVLKLGDGLQPATANLLAPIVVNLRNHVAKQVIQIRSLYSTAVEVS